MKVEAGEEVARTETKARGDDDGTSIAVDDCDVRRVALRIVAHECLDEREHALGCTHAGESRHPLEQLRHARETTSREECGPRVGHLDGLVPACLVPLEVGPLDDDARNVEQRFGERSAVDARRSFFGEHLERGDEPRLRKQIAVTEERAAGRIERGPAVERHHRLEHGEALRVGRRERHALASEPQRRLDKPPPRQAAVLSPQCVERSGKTRDGARRGPDGVGDRLLAEPYFEVDQLSPARRDSGEAVEVARLAPSQTMACAPPSRPVMTVSATHDARTAATAASAAVPPSTRISTAAAAVAGCPAATEARIDPNPDGLAEGRVPVRAPRPDPPATLARDRVPARCVQGRAGRLGLRRRL